MEIYFGFRGLSEAPRIRNKLRNPAAIPARLIINVPHGIAL